jgi:hypothetical protein
MSERVRLSDATPKSAVYRHLDIEASPPQGLDVEICRQIVRVIADQSEFVNPIEHERGTAIDHSMIPNESR